jgi:hypothetical protein
VEKACQPIPTIHQPNENAGDVCGAIFLDDAFELFMELHLGKDEWNDLSSEERLLVMRHQWEDDIKRGFDTTVASTKWVVNLPGRSSRRLAFSWYDSHMQSLKTLDLTRV